jgi:hypothetical protein
MLGMNSKTPISGDGNFSEFLNLAETDVDCGVGVLLLRNDPIFWPTAFHKSA